jgi:hypothetical protein
MSLMDLLTFALGDVTKPPLAKAMATLVVILLMSGAIEIAPAIGRSKAIASFVKRIAAYLMFLIIARRADDMAVDRLFEWQGSTVYVAALGLAVRDGKALVTKVGQWAGVIPPAGLMARMDQLESQIAADRIQDGDGIDQKITALRQNLEKIKEYNALKKETEALLGPSDDPSVDIQKERDAC